MAKRPPKKAPRPKNPKEESQAEHFEDVARKLFKVPKAEITPKTKKP
jgi:hypothetical protein